MKLEKTWLTYQIFEDKTLCSTWLSDWQLVLYFSTFQLYPRSWFQISFEIRNLNWQVNVLRNSASPLCAHLKCFMIMTVQNLLPFVNHWKFSKLFQTSVKIASFWSNMNWSVKTVLVEIFDIQISWYWLTRRWKYSICPTWSFKHQNWHLQFGSIVIDTLLFSVYVSV